MEDIWGRNENQEISKEVAGLLYSAKYGLPTHKEMQDSLTPHTTEYLLVNNRSNINGTVANIIDSINILDSEKSNGGVNFVSLMEPADAHEYLNSRLKGLDHIKNHVDKLTEKLESEVVDLLNSYETDKLED